MNYRYVLSVTTLCCALAITACSSVNADWSKASSENSIASYQAFLDHHASDQHAQEAQTRIASLRDDAAWATAQSANSVNGYQQYLQAEPNGTHAHAARDGLVGLERASAWQSAQADGSATALQAFLQKYPQGKEADQARAKLAALNTNFRDELGRFRDQHAANHKRAELAHRFGAMLKEIEVVSPDSSSKQYRVMSGLMDRHDADAACSSLKREHQMCEVVSANQGKS
jgi:hypothetical protein